MAILSNTLANLRQGLMEYLGAWISGVTSASAAASAGVVTDSVTLTQYQDNFFNTDWLLLTSGTNSTKMQRVSAFSQSAGAMSILSNFSAAIAASVSYELLHYHPTLLIRWALNKALQQVYDKTYRSILNEDLITGNALPNSDFEDWAVATAPNHWALSVATAAKNTSIFRNGRASAAITGGVSAGYMGCEAFTGSSPFWSPLMDLRGFAIDFEVWVKTDTASHARLQIVDSEGTTSSSYHTGGNLWELLKVTRTISSDVTSLAFRITANVDTKVTYADRARAMNGPVSELVLPSELVQADVKKLYIQITSGVLNTNERPCDDMGWVAQPREYPKQRIRYDDRLGVWLLGFDEKPSAGYKMRIEAIEPQTKLTLDTDTVALSETHLNLLYPYAASVLWTALGQAAKAEEHLMKYKRIADRVSMPNIPCSATFPWGRW